jgi:hypothetical protein
VAVAILQEQIIAVVTAVHSVGQQEILEQQLNEGVLTIQNACSGIFFEIGGRESMREGKKQKKPTS